MSEECYSGHAEVPLVNALDECRAERDKLRSALQPFVSEFKRRMAHSGRNSTSRRDWNEKMPDSFEIRLRVTMGDCRTAVRLLKDE